MCAGGSDGCAVSETGGFFLPILSLSGTGEDADGETVGRSKDVAGGELGWSARVGLRHETLGTDAPGADSEAEAGTGEEAARADECATWGECYYCHWFKGLFNIRAFL